jgi:Domain of unknown function (DUF4272)
MHYRYLLAALVVFSFSSSALSSPIVTAQRNKIESVGTRVTPEALQRMERSNTRLLSEGVPINKSLPPIAGINEVRRRTKDEVAQRTMALLVVSLKGKGADPSIVDKMTANYGLNRFFTPKEAAFMRSSSPSKHDRIQFEWRSEAAWTLLWALGYVKTLGKPTATCDIPRAVQFLQERSAHRFLAEAKLRPIASILEEADLIYRYDWAVVEARLNNRAAPAGLDPDIVVERHYALNWLIGYMDQNWDDISTDT